MMKTVELTIEETVFRRVEQVAQRIGISIADFIQQAMDSALRQVKIAEMEQRQIEGYHRYPVTPDEFAVRTDEQAWGEE